eukprot:295880_1
MLNCKLAQDDLQMPNWVNTISATVSISNVENTVFSPYSSPDTVNVTSVSKTIQHLLYGFIRSIQNDLKLVIPIEIIHLCFKFYYISIQYIFCIHQGHNVPKLSVHQMDTQNHWKCKLKHVNYNRKYIIQDCGLINVKNIKLPPTILNIIRENNEETKQTIKHAFV